MEPENWLTSDVVKISGIAGTQAYALQMSFDNRINQSFDGVAAGAQESNQNHIAVA